MRKRVGDIRPTLPVSVVGPGFNDEFGDVFGIIYGFTADGFTQSVCHSGMTRSGQGP